MPSPPYTRETRFPIAALHARNTFPLRRMVRTKHSLSAGTLRGLLRHVYDDLDGQRFHTAQCLSIGIGRRRAKMKIRGVWGTSDFQFILYLFSVNLTCSQVGLCFGRRPIS